MANYDISNTIEWFALCALSFLQKVPVLKVDVIETAASKRFSESQQKDYPADPPLQSFSSYEKDSDASRRDKGSPLRNIDIETNVLLTPEEEEEKRKEILRAYFLLGISGVLLIWGGYKLWKWMFTEVDMEVIAEVIPE